MSIGFSPRSAVSRAAVSCCVLGAAWVAVLPPLPAAADTGSGSGTGSGASRPSASGPSLLYGPGTLTRPQAGVPELPDMSALSWLVADATSGDVLAAHDAHRPLPPASTLKTLFALTVLPALPSDAVHTVSAHDLEGIGAGSSLVGVRQGDSYRVSDLWRGVFLHSGNDAVHVLAALNGGVPATIRQMQAKARALGALDTHVVSPDGYDEEGQVSSAYDLAVFGRTGLQNPDFTRYCGTVESSFPGDDGSTYEIANTNRLLTGRDGVQAYPGLIGIKNGYTSHAGNTLVAAARRGGRTLLVTVMNPRSGRGHAVYEEARSLLDWGFAAAGRVTPVGSLAPARPLALKTRPSAPVKVTPVRASGTFGRHSRGVLAVGVGVGAGVVAAVAHRLWGRRKRTARD